MVSSNSSSSSSSSVIVRYTFQSFLICFYKFLFRLKSISEFSVFLTINADNFGNHLLKFWNPRPIKEFVLNDKWYLHKKYHEHSYIKIGLYPRMEGLESTIINTLLTIEPASKGSWYFECIINRTVPKVPMKNNVTSADRKSKNNSKANLIYWRHWLCVLRRVNEWLNEWMKIETYWMHWNCRINSFYQGFFFYWI